MSNKNNSKDDNHPWDDIPAGGIVFGMLCVGLVIGTFFTILGALFN